MVGPTLRAAAVLGIDLLPASTDTGYEDAVRRLHVALVGELRCGVVDRALSRVILRRADAGARTLRVTSDGRALARSV